MPDVKNIITKIDQAGAIFLGLAMDPLLPETNTKGRARELEMRKKYLTILEETFAEIKENQASFSEADKKAILAAKATYDKRIKEAETKYPEKVKFLKSGDKAAGFDTDVTGSKAQGDADGKALEKDATDWGKTVNGWFNSAKKTAGEAVDDAKALFNADGTPKTDEQKKKEAEQKKKEEEAAAAKGGKSKGFFDSISDWFSDFNGKEVMGGLAGGGIGYMLGKVFGEGTLGTIAGILMSIGGAIMGRNFAHNHFNGDDKSSEGKGGGKAGVDTGKKNAGNNNSAVVPSAAEVSSNYQGMTQEQLNHALAIYNAPVEKPAAVNTDLQLLEFKLAHPLTPNIAKPAKSAAPDDLYGR
jgi:F0F1-type ATP synthase assembly protein I